MSIDKGSISVLDKEYEYSLYNIFPYTWMKKGGRDINRPPVSYFLLSNDLMGQVSLEVMALLAFQGCMSPKEQ